MLTVRLLGRLEATVGSTPVRVIGRQAQALFALLALERRRRSREAIGADLWPDGGAVSPGGLRQALWIVRNALAAAGLDPDSVVDVDGEAIGLRRSTVLQLDVDVFERAARGPLADVEAAIGIYRGDLVELLGHECFASERERLADLYEDTLAAAAANRLGAGDVEGARVIAERLLARDPLREEAHAVLIAVHGRQGTRSQVIRQYRRLCLVLTRELEVEPLPETVLAYRQALALTVARSRRAAALRPVPLLPGLVRRGPALPRHAGLRTIAAGG